MENVFLNTIMENNTNTTIHPLSFIKLDALIIIFVIAGSSTLFYLKMSSNIGTIIRNIKTTTNNAVVKKCGFDWSLILYPSVLIIVNKYSAFLTITFLVVQCLQLL